MPHYEGQRDCSVGEQLRNKSSPPSVPIPQRQRMEDVGSVHANAQSPSSSVSRKRSPSALSGPQVLADCSIASPHAFGSVFAKEGGVGYQRSGSLPARRDGGGDAPESGRGAGGRRSPSSKGPEKCEPSKLSKNGPLVLQKVVRTESLYGIGLAINQDRDGTMKAGKAADLRNRAGQNISCAVQEGDTLLAVDGVVCLLPECFPTKSRSIPTGSTHAHTNTHAFTIVYTYKWTALIFTSSAWQLTFVATCGGGADSEGSSII